MKMPQVLIALLCAISWSGSNYFPLNQGDWWKYDYYHRYSTVNCPFYATGGCWRISFGSLIKSVDSVARDSVYMTNIVFIDSVYRHPSDYLSNLSDDTVRYSPALQETSYTQYRIEGQSVFCEYPRVGDVGVMRSDLAVGDSLYMPQCYRADLYFDSILPVDLPDTVVYAIRGREFSLDYSFYRFAENIGLVQCETHAGAFCQGVIPEDDWSVKLKLSASSRMHPSFSFLPQDSATWCESYQQVFNMEPYCQGPTKRICSSFQVEGRITVGDVIYSRVYSGPVLFGLLRQDKDGKVFFRKNVQDSVEKLLYDFGAGIGDTVRVDRLDCEGCEKAWLVLYEIDSVELFGKTRKRFKFHAPPADEEWVQGVGNIYGLFHQNYNNMGDNFCFSEFWSIDQFYEGEVRACGCDSSHVDNSPGNGTTDCFVSPNPFNPSARIFITLSDRNRGEARLFIYSTAGKLVRKLTAHLANGTAEFAWDGRDMAGNRLSSGVYVGMITASGRHAEIRLLLAK